MNRAAFGIRMHSGWGVLVAVSLNENFVKVLDRRRIVTVDPKMAGAKQPYHYAAEMRVQGQELSKAESFIGECAAASVGLAATAIKEVVCELERRSCHVAACAVLVAAGRPLPALAKILASHPRIQTAEGEFFRNAVGKACTDLRIPVILIRERDVDEQAKTTFGKTISKVQQSLLIAGKSLGPPWTQDHKAAALASAMILRSKNADLSLRSG
jgi:hypothetical protein